MAEADEGEGVELTQDMLELSQLAKTIDGNGFAQVQLSCVGRGVGSIKLVEGYPHLREVDFSNNCITNVAPLATLTFLLKLTLAQNRIDQISHWRMPALQHLLHLDMQGNRMEALPQVFPPALRTANFARNKISSCAEFEGHSHLVSLDLSDNSLENLAGLHEMPLLETLILASNSIPGAAAEEEDGEPTPGTGLSSIEGLRALPQLKVLDISKNIFESFEGAWEEMPALESLIAAENSIEDKPGLQPISGIKKLKSVELGGNKIEVENNIRIEVLICNGGVESINAEPVQEEEREEAKSTHETRVQEERERIAAEEEAARIAAEEAAAAAAAAAEEGEEE
eukprot:TRINITY_DN58086_c0_g1_i1.p1 TRINITY_DN58086_c0_g1~~TRINITY_DN58086_c0_g1_i1.p1  ORF type:complete len:341 (-),score=104.24 TRINITY_DN58086_c0_g1_i1:53-1075(-)